MDPSAVVHTTLRRLLDAAVPLLHPDLSALGERSVALFTKLYKLLVRIAKVRHAPRPAPTPPLTLPSV